MLLEFTDYNFENLMSTTNGLVIVDFWSAWCRPCNMLSPIIKSLAENNKDVTIGKLNTTENFNITKQFNISGIPAILFFKNGKVVRQLLGYHTEAALQHHINELR